MDLRNKRAILTGGARGIGLAVARRLLERGALVSIWDIDPGALEQAARELSVLGGVHSVISAFGGVDVLVNNAGYMAPGFFLDQPVEEWRKTVDINLQGILHTTHAVLPHLYGQGSGHVVNISSAAGLLGVPSLAVYSATKWAVYGLTEALREEAWSTGHPEVRFSSIHPNFLKTGMFEGAQLRGFGAVVFPRVDGHDVVAKAVVEKALVRGRRVVRRPRSLRLVPLLRGILPDPVFGAIGRAAQLHTTMEGWRGRSTGEGAA
ncbi:MAG: SDR family NAD(P)-dependent oxidoreductase [bacterium]